MDTHSTQRIPTAYPEAAEIVEYAGERQVEGITERRDMRLQTWTCRLCGGVIHTSIPNESSWLIVEAARGHLFSAHFNELIEVTTDKEDDNGIN